MNNSTSVVFKKFNVCSNRLWLKNHSSSIVTKCDVIPKSLHIKRSSSVPLASNNITSPSVTFLKLFDHSVTFCKLLLKLFATPNSAFFIINFLLFYLTTLLSLSVAKRPIYEVFSQYRILSIFLPNHLVWLRTH